MASKIPYVVLPRSIPRILNKIKEAQTPERFTQDYLHTKLGFNGGNYNQFIPLAKRLGFLHSDGKPTELYKQFRNESTSKVAMAQAIRHGYKEIFERNEHADSLNDKELKGIVIEITGDDQKSRVPNLICTTFNNLKTFADFDATVSSDKEEKLLPLDEDSITNDSSRNDLDLKLSYSINLVLPKTDDPAVFNAIFRSLRENLLRK